MLRGSLIKIQKNRNRKIQVCSQRQKQIIRHLTNSKSNLQNIQFKQKVIINQNPVFAKYTKIFYFFQSNMDIQKIVERDKFIQFQQRIFQLTLEHDFVCALPALDGSAIIVQQYHKQSDHKNQRQIINHIDKTGNKLGSISFNYSNGQYCIINNTKVVRLGIPYNKICDYSGVISRQSKYFQISLTDWDLLTHDQDNFTLKQPVEEGNLRSIVLFSFPLTQIVSYMLEYYEPEKERLQYRFKTYKVPISSDKGYIYKPLVYIFPKTSTKFLQYEFRCTKLNDQQKLAIYSFLLDSDDKQFKFVSIDLIKGEIKEYKFQFPQDFPCTFNKEAIRMKNKSYLNKVMYQTDVWEMFPDIFYLRFQTTQSRILKRRSWTYYWDSKTGSIVSPHDQPKDICYLAVFSNSLRINQYFQNRGKIYCINLYTMKMSYLEMPEKKAQKYLTYRDKKIYTEYHPRVLIANYKQNKNLRSSVFELLQFPYSHEEYIIFMIQETIHDCDKDLVEMIIKLSVLNKGRTVFDKKSS